MSFPSSPYSHEYHSFALLHSLDNWQTALRKQYRKRDPTANPIGPEPRSLSPEPRSSSPAPGVHDHPTEERVIGLVSTPSPSTHPDTNIHTDPDMDGEMDPPDPTRASTLELDRGPSLGARAKGLSVQPSEPDSLHASSGHLGDYPEVQEEVRDWFELPMLTKLDSMHLLAEWQFQNPMRLRTLMRSDNDDATWVCFSPCRSWLSALTCFHKRIEPIGYDSKKNAYWLIGGALNPTLPALLLKSLLFSGSRPPMASTSYPKTTSSIKIKTYS